MRIKLYKDKAGEWRWCMIATNGNIVADSSEGYKNKLDCLETLHGIFKYVRDVSYPVIEDIDSEML